MAKILLEPFELRLWITELDVDTITGIIKTEDGESAKKTYYKLMGPNLNGDLVKREEGNELIPPVIARLIDDHEIQGSFSEEQIPTVDAFLSQLHPDMQTRKTI